MLVYVVRLRQRGVRLSREAAMLAVPVRGLLRLEESKPGWHRNRLMAGLLREGTTEWVLPPLDDARVLKINEKGMLIVGVEQEGRSSSRLQAFRQAWWVRVVGAR